MTHAAFTPRLRSQPIRLSFRVHCRRIAAFLVLLLLSPGFSQEEFLRGDLDGDGKVTEADAEILGAEVFEAGGGVRCLDAADVDDDGDLDAVDHVLILEYLFGGGAPPAPPHPDCGKDPTDDDKLDCQDPGFCEGSGKESEPRPEPSTGPFGVDPTVQPVMDSMEPYLGVSRPLAALRNPNGLVESFVVDQVIVRAESDDELTAFLERVDGVLLDDGSLPEMPPCDDPGRQRKLDPSPFYLVRVNLERVDASRLADDAKAVGIEDGYAVSSSDGRKLIALLLREALAGTDVFVDRPVETHLEEHPTVGGAFLDPENGCNPVAFPEVCDSVIPFTRVNMSWKYARLTGVSYRPLVAVIDRGFAVDASGSPAFGNLDLPTSVGAAYRWHFSRGSGDVSGPNVQECASSGVVPGKCWHATAVTNVSTARHDNRFGTAGTARRADPMYFYSAGLFEMARAIRLAIRQGADVINISMGLTCGGLCDTFGIISGDGPLEDAAFAAAHNRVPIVASAGNSELDLDNVREIPCELYGVLCVGRLGRNSLSASVTPSRSGSNYNGEVDLFAPGTNLRIASLPVPAMIPVPGMPPVPNPLLWTPGSTAPGLGNLDTFNGTSAASPFVAGVVANLKALDPSLSVWAILATLQRTATSSPDPRVAPGIVDALAAAYDVNRQTPAGEMSSPEPSSRWDGEVQLAVDLLPVLIPSRVEYFARYRSSPGAPPATHSIAVTNVSTDFEATWDVSGLPTQLNVQVWALLTGPTGSLGITPESSGVGLNVDASHPTGLVTSPASGSVQGLDVPLQVMVEDPSGVAAVTYFITSSQGLLSEISGDPTSGFSANWSSRGYAGETITVEATARDSLGNEGPLSPATGITIDHGAPTISMVWPPASPVDAVWVTTSGTIQARARASDPTGISSVRFDATYRDDTGQLVHELLGVDTTPNAAGEFSALWNLAAVPDQADRTFPYETIVEAVATDAVGNTSPAAAGWIIGIDRQAPQLDILQPATSVSLQGGTLAIEVDSSDAIGIHGGVNELLVTAEYTTALGVPATEHELARIANTGYWSGTMELSVLPEQTLRLRARATDDAGNVAILERVIQIDRSGPAITLLGHSPDPFYAGGGLAMGISYELDSPASLVVLSILDASGLVVAEVTRSNVSTAPQVISWDGLDRGGAVVSSGTYSYRIDALDSLGNLGTVNSPGFVLISDTTPPTVQIQGPSTVSLLTKKTVDFTWQVSEAARVEFEIHGATGSVLRYFGSTNVSAATSGTVPWNLELTTPPGPAAPGSYEFFVRATDLAGHETTAVHSIQVQP